MTGIRTIKGARLVQPSPAGPASSAWYADGREFDHPVRQFFFVEIGHEIISTAILPLPLIQVGQMSVAGKGICTEYWLTA